MNPVRVYLVPGLFGFARLAGFDYFQHVRAALEERFRARRRTLEVHVVDAHPTSSLRRRAARLAETVASTAGGGDVSIHLLGHSSGGLDARLVASPTAQLGTGPDPTGWLPRLHSITSLNTPHYGTPLAGFFATAKGTDLLYALSLITVTALKLGAPPLATASALVASLRRQRQAPRIDRALSERLIDSVTRVLDDASSRELRGWLRQIREDRGGIVQLMPEAMDLFEASVEQRPGVRYQCVASYVPPRRERHWLRSLRSPWSAVSAVLFQMLHGVAALVPKGYPTAPPDGGDDVLRALLGEIPPVGANDGVVPLRSQLWGTPVWIGAGDHLDVIGHFRGRGHTDWLTSGADFDAPRFETVMDRIVAGMLEAEDGSGA